jgi:hypothetical protein
VRTLTLAATFLLFTHPAVGHAGDDAHPELPWRVSAAVSDEHRASAGSRAIGLGRRAAPSIAVERSLAPWAPPFFAAVLALSYRRGTSDAGPALGLLEAQLGVTASSPVSLFGCVAPYARLSTLWARAKMELGSRFYDAAFVPGFEAALGTRLSLPGHAHGSGSRLYAFADASYAWRRPTALTLRLTSSDKGPGALPPLRGPATELGAVRLSAWAWRAGIGIEL